MNGIVINVNFILITFNRFQWIYPSRININTLLKSTRKCIDNRKIPRIHLSFGNKVIELSVSGESILKLMCSEMY